MKFDTTNIDAQHWLDKFCEVSGYKDDGTLFGYFCNYRFAISDPLDNKYDVLKLENEKLRDAIEILSKYSEGITDLSIEYKNAIVNLDATPELTSNNKVKSPYNLSGREQEALHNALKDSSILISKGIDSTTEE